MSTTERYQGWANWDTWETALILTNDYDFYIRSYVPWLKNFQRKIKRGIFDRDLAKKAIRLYLLPFARKEDPDIDPKKVNLDEILDSMLEDVKGLGSEGP